MTLTQPFIVYDRKHAGKLLADKLSHLKNANAVVVAVPNGGAVVGYHLAKALHLPFDVVPCKKISHPADNKKTIGSISADDVVIHGESYDIPRDYIYHQIVLNQNALRAKRHFVCGPRLPVNVKGKKVILVGDLIGSADSLLASLRSLRNQKSLAIYVAITVATPDVVTQLAGSVDDLVLLGVDDNVQAENIYEEHPRISDTDVRELILKAMNEHNNE